VPGEESKEKQAEVEQHNREFEQGHDRASKAGEDKVDKKFWSGESSFLDLGDGWMLMFVNRPGRCR
jgi:hypothetical protein